MRRRIKSLVAMLMVLSLCSALFIGYCPLEVNADSVAESAETVHVNDDFSSSQLSEGWTVTKGKLNIQDGKLQSAASFTANTDEEFANGYVEADITIGEPLPALSDATSKKSVYTGYLVARDNENTGDRHEIWSRFMITNTPDADGNPVYSAALTAVFYNKTNYGASAKSYTDYTIPNFQFGKSYKVRLTCVGNYVEISIDGVVAYQFCFAEGNVMDSKVGTFGIEAGKDATVYYDNVKIAEYDSYQVHIAAENQETLSIEGFKDPKLTGITKRNAYYVGEKVKVTSSAPDFQVVDVMTYHSNATGSVAATAESDNVYYFNMPATDVTVSATFKDNPDQSLKEVALVDENFETSTDIAKVLSADNGWQSPSGTSAIKNGKLYSSTAFSVNAAEQFVDGYIEADIIIETPSDKLLNATEETTVYTGNMSARNTGDTHEIRSRFGITYNPETKKYSGTLDLVCYDKTDYGTRARGSSYAIPNFAIGQTYHVKLTVIGNYVEISLDDNAVIQHCFAEGNAMIDRTGLFGISTTKNSAEVSYDNVRIAKNRTFSASVSQGSASFIYLDAFADPYKDVKGLNQRTEYVPGEFVLVNIEAPDNYKLDESTLVYTTDAGAIKITEKDSDTLYAFQMPADAVVVSGKLVDGNSLRNDIWFSDNFDEESLMKERGWNKNIEIVDGAMRIDSDVISNLQVTGIKSAVNWKNYVVEGDVTLDEETYKANGCVAITFRGNTNKEGYEFGVYSGTEPDAGYFRLYDRKTGTLLATTEIGTAVAGQTYHLLAAVSDGNIFCYADGKQIFTVQNNQTNAEGTIGIRVAKAVGMIDNLVVRELDPALLVGAQTGMSPQTGDAVKLLLPICMWVCSGGLLVTVYRRRKRAIATRG